MRTLFTLLVVLTGCFPFFLRAQLAPDTMELDTAAMFAAYEAYVDSIEKTLTFYVDTTVTLGDGLADLAIPEGYTFVDGDDARTVLVDLWGNPPTAGEGSLGMLFPEKYRPSDAGGYGVDIFFTDDGYIDDEDAVDMDFDEILESMREGIAEDNEYRRAEGYQTMDLVGWATPPHYDLDNKRLHWAKELHFEGEEANTLNYNILFLGRRGYLTMNVIGDMEDLPEVNADLDDFLGSVAYNEGHRYMDFDPSMDQVAAYGVGALVAGKVLAKTGLLATIGIFLAKAWKLIAIAAVALLGGLKKVLNSGK